MISDDQPTESSEEGGAADHSPEGTARGNSRLVRLFVDEISEGEARVLVNEQVLTLPLTFLPEGVREGDWVELGTQVIAAPPTATAERRKRLAADDPGGPIKL